MSLAPNKLAKAITYSLGALMVGTLSLALSVSGGLKNDPPVSDPATGHTIAMSVRGVGTRYMTAAEWAAISPYWDAFYVCGGIFATFGIGTILVKAYQGFADGWRSDTKS